MRLCLFEDHLVSAFEPMISTRPVFDLICGLQSLRAKQVRYFGSGLVGKLVRPELADWVQDQSTGEPVNDWDWLRAGPVVLVNGRWLPPDGPPPVCDSPQIALADDDVAWVCLTPDRLRTFRIENLEEHLASWRRQLPNRIAGGRLVRRAWDLIASNADEIVRDFRSLSPRDTGVRPMDFSLVGPAGRLHINPSARIDPLVVADTTGGPVVIERDAVVTAFSRLEGPCGVGSAAEVRSAQILAGTTIGTACVVGGEIASSILQGFVEKPHQGYLGHSYVGEWVECGAGMQTSDRHPWERVSRPSNRPGRVFSRSVPQGCLIGDHARIAAGSILPSGAFIGAFTVVEPSGAMAPVYLPSFTAFRHGRVDHDDDGDQWIDQAEEHMQERNIEPSPTLQELYRRLLDSRAGAKGPRFRRLRESA